MVRSRAGLIHPAEGASKDFCALRESWQNPHVTTRDSWDWDQIAGAIGRVGGIYRDFMAGLDDRRVTPVVDRENLRTRFRGSILYAIGDPRTYGITVRAKF